MKMRRYTILFLLFLLLFSRLHTRAAALDLLDDVKPLDLLESSLTLTANFYSGDEDEKSFPIAEKEFYLFARNPADILKKGGFEPESAEDGQTAASERDYLTATARAFSATDSESALVSVLIKENLFIPNSLVLKTNQRGQHRVTGVKPGGYYLFGVAESAGEIFVWNLPVEIKRGLNSIEIDQYNAEVVIPVDQ